MCCCRSSRRITRWSAAACCVLRAICEVLGAEIATDEVIAAWTAAYQQLADILIGAEEKIYADVAALPGGWRGSRPFRMARKVAESAEITSFYLEPQDGGALADFEPGQYVGLRLLVNGQELCAQPRGARVSRRHRGAQCPAYPAQALLCL